jgi:superoxide dismutase, Cu-Zn family
MRSILALAASALVLAACGSADDAATDTAGAIDPGAPVAGTADPAAGAGITAVMRDSAGTELGTVTLADASGGIAISGTLRGIAPGTHAFHLHTTGQCEPTFEAAGGHWNPTNAEHGTEAAQGPHLGDMPNVTVGDDSTVTIQATTPGGSLRGENALLDADGAAVMLHAGTDDYRSQPSGDAGGRIACGVVQG